MYSTLDYAVSLLKAWSIPLTLLERDPTNSLGNWLLGAYFELG